jgi:predicted Co/Zn/Cd cation transporter (cation efflux family)
VEYIQVQKQILTRTLVLIMVLATSAFIFGRTPAAYGVLVGGILAMLNFRLLALGVVRLLENTDPNAARVQATIRYAIRYSLTALVLYTISLYPQIDLLAAAVGLLLVKFVILGGAAAAFLREQAQLLIPPGKE